MAPPFIACTDIGMSPCPVIKMIGSCLFAAANRQLPIIFITGHGDIPMSVQAMKGGAIEFLTKPFRDQELLEAIQLGLARDRAKREKEKHLAELRERFGSLSVREQEIMLHVARGRLSKQIAGDI